MSRIASRPSPVSANQTHSALRAFGRRSLVSLATAFAATGALVVATPAFAQETREGQKSAERADKASQLHENAPNSLERRIQRIEGMLTSNRPIYVAMGSSYDGAGLALGPGYRARFGDTGAVDARATLSYRRVKTAEAKLKLPELASNRLALDVHGSWIDAPRAAFFGVGADSVKANRSTFDYSSKSAGVGGTFKATDSLHFGASLDAIHAEGTLGNVTTPIDPTYRKTAVRAEFDTRPSPDYSRRGSLARVEWADYSQTNVGNYSFRRVDAEVQQLVPLMRENWVLAFRALASTTDTEVGQDVPYFLMPELGGSRLLRGYSSWRFRDRNRLLLTGEYRWTAGPLVDMAVFVDAGKVTARRADLNLKNLEFSQGIGVRIHTPSATVTRLEVARSHEGTSLILSFSPSF